MSGTVKIYGLIFMFGVCLVVFLDYDRKIIVTDTLFEAVRSTQMSVIDEAMNKGDYLVHGDLTICKDRTMDLWQQKMEQNHGVYSNTEVRFVDIHENPAAVAVSVRESAAGMMKKEIDTQYDNVIVLDKNEVSGE